MSRVDSATSGREYDPHTPGCMDNEGGVCGECVECMGPHYRPEQPAATDPAINVNDAAWALRIGWPEPARTLRYWLAFKVENNNEREYLLGKLDELMEGRT